MGGGAKGPSGEQLRLQQESLALQRQNMELQRAQIERDEKKSNEALEQAKQARLNRIRGRLLLLNDEIGAAGAPALATAPQTEPQARLGG